MAFLPVPNAVKVALEFTFGTRTVIVTLAFVNSGDPTPSQMTGLGNALKSWYHTNMAPLVTADLALKNISITDLTTATSPQVQVPVSPPDPGVVSGNSESAQTAIASSFYTNTRGRSYRGRAFWPGIPVIERDTDPQHVQQSYVSEIAAAVTQLLTVGSSNNFTHCVISRRANKLPRPTGITTPITSYLVNRRFDTQRRRIGGVSK